MAGSVALMCPIVLLLGLLKSTTEFVGICGPSCSFHVVLFVC